MFESLSSLCMLVFLSMCSSDSVGAATVSAWWGKAGWFGWKIAQGESRVRVGARCFSIFTYDLEFKINSNDQSARKASIKLQGLEFGASYAIG